MAFPSIFRVHPVTGWLDTGDVLGPLDRAHVGGFVPRIDVLEREADFLVTAELPGLEEKDFQVQVHGSALTLSGEKRLELPEQRKGWRWSERGYGSFRRSIQLPMDVASDRASATFKNGVLSITLPKAEHARVRHIEVTAG